MSVRGRASLPARQQLDPYFLARSQDRFQVTLTGDLGGKPRLDTPVTSPEGSDKGGKLPRQLKLAPPRRGFFGAFSSGCRHSNQPRGWAFRRWLAADV